ncbi:MAG TPA: hypothetical protein VF049_19025 [Nocardioidaceae bacterium]
MTDNKVTATVWAENGVITMVQGVGRGDVEVRFAVHEASTPRGDTPDATRDGRCAGSLLLRPLTVAAFATMLRAVSGVRTGGSPAGALQPPEWAVQQASLECSPAADWRAVFTRAWQVVQDLEDGEAL